KTAFGYVKKFLEEGGRIVSKAEEKRLSLGIVGVKKTTGQHPGGLVIIPEGMDITDFCPVQRPADKTEGDAITTHFDYHKMEDNLLKLDELGHDDPTMLKMLEDMTGVDAKKIPLDDPETMSIFISPKILGLTEDDAIIGKTGSIGISEFGTSFTREMLCDTKPKNFDTLVRLSGFSHGTGVWLDNARDLIMEKKIAVTDTIGCRDDIMLYLISLGMDEKYAFKIMEAVRKGRGITPDEEADMREIGAPQWYIDSCKKIKYLFPKAHAVAYVMLAFRIAWFKVHRPLQFYAAYFYRRSQKDNFDAEFMTSGIETAKKKIIDIKNDPKPTAKDKNLLVTLEAVYEFYLRGFSFTGIDIYKSDATKFLIEDEKSLRPPFISIAGIGETAALEITSIKNSGESFVSIEDMTRSIPKLGLAGIETLKSLGVFGDLPENSQMCLF
ncbi:PolC-type DNA polymerase III, partial [Clostridiaceae bacterium OttesenSCG-928-D20]|nr:PolC-type DNA polymerase III [Clostridiaceae bacterium OttesenSCG-928-D20]